MIKKIIIFICLVVPIIGFILIKKHKNKKNRLMYVTEKPTRQNLEQYITASGTIQPKELTSFTVGSLVAGRVEKIYARYNEKVKKGQVLAVIDNGIGDTALKQAQAQLEEAKTTYEYQKKFYARQTNLYQAKQIAQNQYDAFTQDYLVAEHKVAQAQANVQLQQKTYENLFIKAPDDGVIISKDVDLGQAITAQLQATVIFRMAKDLKDLEVYADVDEADVGLVHANQEAVFSVDAFPQRRYKATVRLTQYLSKVIDNIVTYATILPIHNEDLSLRPGMTANILIKVRDSKNALTIPNKALRINGLKLEEYAQKTKIPFSKLPESLFKKGITKPRQDFLWIEESKHIKQVAVTFGANDGKYTEITTGITQETNVITELLDATNNTQFLSGFVGGGGIGK